MIASIGYKHIMARVLVIDDNEAFRELLVEMLKAVGHTTAAAANGMEALKAFRAQPADIILTDLIMPYDGLATIRILHAEFPSLAIIAMTGGGSHRLDYALTVGAKKVLTKPFSAAQLVAAIDDVLKKPAQAVPIA
jgi:CheY-like chemotaxis protein